MSIHFLKHHGVQGQKWGERHGPPYPLDPNKATQAQRKANYTPEKKTDKVVGSQRDLDKAAKLKTKASKYDVKAANYKTKSAKALAKNQNQTAAKFYLKSAKAEKASAKANLKAEKLIDKDNKERKNGVYDERERKALVNELEVMARRGRKEVDWDNEDRITDKIRENPKVIEIEANAYKSPEGKALYDASEVQRRFYNMSAEEETPYIMKAIKARGLSEEEYDWALNWYRYDDGDQGDMSMPDSSLYWLAKDMGKDPVQAQHDYDTAWNNLETKVGNEVRDYLKIPEGKNKTLDWCIDDVGVRVAAELVYKKKK